MTDSRIVTFSRANYPSEKASRTCIRNAEPISRASARRTDIDFDPNRPALSNNVPEPVNRLAERHAESSETASTSCYRLAHSAKQRNEPSPARVSSASLSRRCAPSMTDVYGRTAQRDTASFSVTSWLRSEIDPAAPAEQPSTRRSAGPFQSNGSTGTFHHVSAAPVTTSRSLQICSLTSSRTSVPKVCTRGLHR